MTGKKKSELEAGKTIGARRSGDDVGRSRISDSNDRRSSSIDFLLGSGVAVNDDADLLPNSSRRSCAVGVIDERRGGGGGAIYRRAAEEMDQRTCFDTMIN